MVSELGLTGGCEFESRLPNLYVCFHIWYIFLSVEYKSKFCLSFYVQGMRPYVRESIKKHDMHIEPKFCKFKLLRKLVIQHL